MLGKSKVYGLKILIFFIYCFASIAQAISLEVNIHGVDKELVELIKTDLTINEAINEPKLTKRRIHNLYDLAENEITSVLESCGYYNSSISQDIKNVGEHWITNFYIKTGPQTIINSTTFKISGSSIPAPKMNREFHNALKKLERGKNFTHDEYEEVKKALLQALSDNGYLKGKLTSHQVELNRETNLANIHLEIETGPRFVFGQVTFHSTRFDEDLLRRYIPFKSNEDYSMAKMQQFHKNLENSGFFSKIRIDILPDFANNIVNMNVRLEPRPFSKYTGSIGYGTDLGVRAGLGWSRVLESQPGHRISSLLKWSQRKTLANISYYIPGEQAADDRYIFSASIQQEKLDGGRDSLKNEVSAVKQQKRNNTEVTYSLNYFGERFRLSNTSDIKLKKFLLPNMRFTWINEARDLKLSIYIRAASRYLASDGSIASFETDVKKIFEIDDNNKITIHNQMGGLKTDNFDNLPPSLRFYAGGDYSVRGYDYKTLGPTKYDDTNKKTIIIGGRYLFTASIEYQRIFYKNFGGAVFIDSGNAFNNLKSVNKLAVSAGIGIRYQTPLGTIKVDIAKPLNMAPKKRFKLHLSFGADF